MNSLSLVSGKDHKPVAIAIITKQYPHNRRKEANNEA